MESIARNAKPATPERDPHGVKGKDAENKNPNVARFSPGSKPSGSPAVKSAKAKKSGSKNRALPEQNPVVCSPRKKIQERKFVVAKKKKNPKRKDGEGAAGLGPVECNCRENLGDGRRCLCVAYESLRASQEEFFKNRADGEEAKGELGEEMGEIEVRYEVGAGNGLENGPEAPVGTGSPTMKRRREKLLEQFRSSVPKFGKVKNLVNAFEEMLTLNELKKEQDKNQKEEEEEKEKEGKRKAMQWALPGLHVPSKVADADQGPSSTFCTSDLYLTSENLGLDSRFLVSSSRDGSQDSISNRASNGGRRSRRNSSESCGTMSDGRRGKKKQVKATSQKPFKLRTEQRGKMKEDEFIKKLQEMMIEEEKQRIPVAQGLPWTTDEPELLKHGRRVGFNEKQRIPVAQGLPWTTDEPECLVKPPIKEKTRPVEPKLHTDARAAERAEFDHQVSEKLSLMEQYKMERERQWKLAEEEELRRLRKELIPKAQPMPYFDRPFIPKKHQRKIKCCVSRNDISSCNSCLQ